MAKPVKHYGKWRIRWVDQYGRRRSQTFESYAEAETALALRTLEKRGIQTGLNLASTTRHRFGDLCTRWVEHRAINKRSAKSDHSIIRCHLAPFFKNIDLSKIDLALVETFQRRLGCGRKPKTVHNVLTLLRAMLRYACDLGWVDNVPRFNLPKITLNQSEFRYLRTEAEIRRFLRAAGGEGSGELID